MTGPQFSHLCRMSRMSRVPSSLTCAERHTCDGSPVLFELHDRLVVAQVVQQDAAVREPHRHHVHRRRLQPASEDRVHQSGIHSLGLNRSQRAPGHTFSELNLRSRQSRDADARMCTQNARVQLPAYIERYRKGPKPVQARAHEHTHLDAGRTHTHHGTGHTHTHLGAGHTHMHHGAEYTHTHTHTSSLWTHTHTPWCRTHTHTPWCRTHTHTHTVVPWCRTHTHTHRGAGHTHTPWCRTHTHTPWCRTHTHTPWCRTHTHTNTHTHARTVVQDTHTHTHTHLLERGDAGAPPRERVDEPRLEHVPQLQRPLPTREHQLVEVRARVQHARHVECGRVKLQLQVQLCNMCVCVRYAFT